MLGNVERSVVALEPAGNQHKLNCDAEEAIKIADMFVQSMNELVPRESGPQDNIS